MQTNLSVNETLTACRHLSVLPHWQNINIS